MIRRLHQPPRRRALPRSFAIAAATIGVGAFARADALQDYMLHCMGCHGAQAQGVPGKVPPLAHTLARFMRSGAGRNYVLRVPGAANSMLSDAQLAQVLNWLAERYGSDELSSSTAPFTEAEVASARHKPLADVAATRRAVIAELAATGPAPDGQY